MAGPPSTISTVGAFLLAFSTLPFFWSVYTSAHESSVWVDDPWGWGRSLEWATSCPPPRHNFVTIPRIRSASPAFDLRPPRSRPLSRTALAALAPPRAEGAHDPKANDPTLSNLAELPLIELSGGGLRMRYHARVT
jgi:cytochrome c oxidase subunit 1